MVNCNEYNDNELLDMIFEGNEIAKEILYSKYDRVIKVYISKYVKFAKNIGLDREDLYQEGMIGLEGAINNFNGKDSKFSTFAALCIDRKIRTVITTANRQKNKILNNSLSLDYVNDDDIPLIDYVCESDLYEPLNYIMDIENTFNLDCKIRDNLSNFEIQVYELLCGNFTYDEIASILDKDLKSVDNAIQRIRKKINKLLN